MSGSFPGVATGGGSGIALTDLSATVPLIYNNDTGAFALPAATTTDPGHLSATDKAKIDGLGTISTQEANSVAITGGAISGTAFAPSTTVGTAAGQISRSGDLIQYRNGANNATLTLLNSAGNLANLADSAAAVANLSARLADISGGFATAPALSTPRKNATGTAIEYAPRSGYIRIINISGNFTFTGTTTETALTSFEIPANTLQDGDVFCVELLGETVSNANNKTIRVRVGGISGQVLISNTNTAHLSFGGLKSFFCNNNEIEYQFNVISVSAGTVNPRTLFTLNFNQSNTLFFTGLLTNAADSISLRRIHLYILRP